MFRANLLRVLLTNEEAVAGGQLGIGYNPQSVEVGQVRPVGPLGAVRDGQGPEFFQCIPAAHTSHCNEASAGMIISWNTTVDDSGAIPAGTEVEIFEIEFLCPPDVSVQTQSRVCFEECLSEGAESDPVDIALTLADEISISPDLGPCQEIEFGCPILFRRGDVNGDGGLDLSDAIKILGFLFDGKPLNCLDAADSNDDGGVDIGDAIFVLTYLFSGGEAPPAPGPENCGPDLTDDELGCESYEACD